MAQQMNINIPLKQLKDRVCSCGGTVFISAVALKEIPALYSPSGKVETAITQVGFVCCGCGKLMSLRPVEPKEEKSKITLVGG